MPAYLKNDPELGLSIAYLRQRADSIRVSLWLNEHTTASNLGEEFEESLAEHDMLAIEYNGYQQATADILENLTSGRIASEEIEAVLPYGHGWQGRVTNRTDFVSRLLRSIDGSKKAVGIADVCDQGSPPEQAVGWLRRSAQKEGNAALWEIQNAHREWIMVGRLGNLLLRRPATSRVLYAVGANHFLLQDKLMTLGIMPQVIWASGDGGLTDPDSEMVRLFPLRNVGHIVPTAQDMRNL